MCMIYIMYLPLTRSVETRRGRKGCGERNLGGPGPRRPSHLDNSRLFNYLYHVHVQNEYAYASPPSPLVRSSRTLRLGKQPARIAQGLQPPIQPTAPPPVLAPRISHLAPGTSHFTNEYLPQQQQQGTGMDTTNEPTSGV